MTALTKRSLSVGVMVLALGSAVAAVELVRPQAEDREFQWREIAWPFPRDGWPAGRAFRCATAACADIEIYVRPKIGFCNCEGGVADDDEVDRVADVDLISEAFAPIAQGEVVRLAGMAGRTRRYDLRMSDGSMLAAVGIAVSRRCDLLVAAARGRGEAPAVQRAVTDFLSSDAMSRWIVAALDAQ
jgi:hypothetical protein